MSKDPTPPFELPNGPQDGPINVPDIMSRIRQNMADRRERDPMLYSVTLAEDRLAVRDALKELKVRLEKHGTLGVPGKGFKAKLIFLVKRVIKKLIQRHLTQQKEELETLVRLFDELIPYLDQQTRQVANCLNRVSSLEANWARLQVGTPETSSQSKPQTQTETQVSTHTLSQE